MRDLFHFSAAADSGQEDGKFVATESSQHIVATQLPLHAVGDFLKKEISDLVSVNIVHLLEVVEVDVDQTEDRCILTRLFDLPFQVILERESIVDVGEQIEFGAADEGGVEAPGFNRQTGQCCRLKESLRLGSSLPGEWIERGINVSERRPGAGLDPLVNDTECIEAGWAISK